MIKCKWSTYLIAPLANLQRQKGRAKHYALPPPASSQYTQVALDREERSGWMDTLWTGYVRYQDMLAGLMDK
jgi:hypothetical protein